MKNILFLASITLLLLACKTDPQESKSTEGKLSNVIPSDQVDPKSKTSQIIANSNPGTPASSNDYSNSFIQKMMSGKDKANVTLNGNQLIIDDGEAVEFPDFPEVNKEIELAGKNEKFRIIAKIKRVNLTSLNFDISIQQKSGETCTYKGLADLSPQFYLGSESNEDEKTGLSYFATEFSAPSPECTNLSIRIGQAEDGSKKETLAKLIINCKDACVGIDLESGPTLR